MIGIVWRSLLLLGLFLAGLNLLGLIPQEASRPSVVAEQ
ncbi:Uncharacterised protein [Roseomonas mucosa]|uniref:Uncharacterized protein n=1 Tax=Roseomonas mucosa TaxID=207340 RepID=A0A379PJL5_9PROT|nr:Uncharacterised protein [Roseomonas mucosa]